MAGTGYRVRNTFLELVPEIEGTSSSIRAFSAGPSLDRHGIARKTAFDSDDDPDFEDYLEDSRTFGRCVTDGMAERMGHQPLIDFGDEILKRGHKHKHKAGSDSGASSETESTCATTAVATPRGRTEEDTSFVSSQETCLSPAAEPDYEDACTDAMICCIPCRITSAEFAEGLARFGLSGTFDSVYLPQNSKKRSNYGYAFVHFFSPEMFNLAQDRLSGQVFDAEKLPKACQVKPARLQGQSRPRHF